VRGAAVSGSAQRNALAESGRPLFFAVENAGRSGLAMPPARNAEAIRVCGRSLSGMQKEALVATSRSQAVWRLASDEGAYLAGLDEAPCPLSFFTTGMVCSYMTQLLAAASSQGLAIDRLRLVLDSYYTMTGSALKGTMTGGAKNPALTVEIESGGELDRWNAVARAATVAAPVQGLLRESLRSRFSLTHNGQAVPGARVGAIDAPTERDPDVLFARAEQQSGDWPELVRRAGKTPRLKHTVTLANDSLAEQQSRLLHVRGICTVRADGLFDVEQHLYNPHGSIFHLLCDDATVAGARAPDAATYVAAGIAFCFLTQFGRYAAIARRNLQHYRVTQDLRWSPGSTSEAAQEGMAEPVETHVFLDSTEDDGFARTLLEMGEQTCFLHALCRSALRTDVTVRPFAKDGSLPEARAPAA
jgi:hypothetical protein